MLQKLFGQNLKKWGIPLIVLIILTFCQQYFFNFLDDLEVQSLTTRQRLFATNEPRGNISPISIIAFDKKTELEPQMEVLFGHFWSREVNAYLIKFFKRVPTKAVIFDMSFNGGPRIDHPEGDVEMVESLKNTHHVISALHFELISDPKLFWENQSPLAQNTLLKNSLQIKGLESFNLLKHYGYPSLKVPFEQLLTSGMRFASSTALRYDDDGIVRGWFPFNQYGPLWFPTLGLGGILQGEQKLSLSTDGTLSWKTGKIRLGPEGIPLIKWYGKIPEEQIENGENIVPLYPRFSVWDIIFSEIKIECSQNPNAPVCSKIKFQKNQLFLSPEIFQNRFVLIGSTYENSGDMHPTIFGGRKYPGVFVWANILDNILHDDFIIPAPAWKTWLCFLLGFGCVLWAALRFQSVLTALWFTLILASGHFLLSVYAYNHWNMWLNTVYPITGMFLTFSGAYVYRYKQAENLKQQLRFAFGKYVSPAVMHTIEKNPSEVKLGGQKRELTMLFSDIRGFTTFSENNDAKLVQTTLTRYFSLMNKIILHQYNGAINKLIGDAIMAYWGFPLENQDHAFLAVSSALAMKEAMALWQADPSNPPIKIGVGINTGEVMIGNVGSEDFMDFTVIGDAVNVASRLESLNKEYGTTIIISASTYEKVKDRIQARPLGGVKVKGKEQEVQIYEPLGFLT